VGDNLSTIINQSNTNTNPNTNQTSNSPFSSTLTITHDRVAPIQPTISYPQVSSQGIATNSNGNTGNNYSTNGISGSITLVGTQVSQLINLGTCSLAGGNGNGYQNNPSIVPNNSLTGLPCTQDYNPYDITNQTSITLATNSESRSDILQNTKPSYQSSK
jgi:hypothetical protein